MGDADEKITPEKLRKDWKTFKYYKSHLLSFIIGIISAGTTMLGLWNWATKPAMQKMIDQNNRKLFVQDSIKQANSGGFRSEMGVFWNLPAEAVPYELHLKTIRYDSALIWMDKFQNQYMPFLQERMAEFPLGEYIDSEGKHKVRMLDLQSHTINWDGRVKWVVYHGHRTNL